jgi:hypothetical protein
VRRAIPLAALLALLAAPSSATAAQPAVRACDTTGRSVAGNALVRVYRHRDVVYACSRENGRRMRLGDDYPGSSSGFAWVRPLVVAGRLVAWQANEGRPQEALGPQRFAIADVRGGRRLVDRRVAPPGVGEVVLRANGSAAWIERDEQAAGATLRRRDPSGEAVLAQGDVRGLALAERSALYWTEAGVPRSGHLDPGERPPPAPVARDRCAAPGATLVANPWVRVASDGGDHRACSLETGRAVFLGEDYASSSGTVRLGPFALARRRVAYYVSACPDYNHSPPDATCRYGVELVALRPRKRTTFSRTNGRMAARDQELVLEQNGSLAWLEPGGVRVVDGAGDRVMGPGRELALSKSSTLYWTRPDGTPASVPLD